MRRRLLFVTLLLAAILLVLLGGGLAYASREPAWNPAYFTPHYQGKYATLEQAFELHMKALQATEATLYNEVLGYESGLSDKDFPLYSGPMPTIKELKVDGDWGFIWTDTHTGTHWEANYWRVKGRWVFQPEDLRFILLHFLKSLGR